MIHTLIDSTGRHTLVSLAVTRGTPSEACLWDFLRSGTPAPVKLEGTDSLGVPFRVDGQYMVTACEVETTAVGEPCTRFYFSEVPARPALRLVH